MTYPTIYLLRHGQTEWNAIRRVQGQRNADLSPLGRRQAAAQGRLLRPILAADPGIVVHCSPLRRTRQTAWIALGGDLTRLRLDARLKEVSMGDWEGWRHDQIAARWPEAYASGKTPFARCTSAPGGERLADLRARAESFLEDLRINTPPQSPAVIVAHGIINIVIRGLLRGLPPEDWGQLDSAQGVVLELRDGQERLLQEPEDTMIRGA